MVPLQNKYRLLNRSGSRCQGCKTVRIEIYRLDVFCRGESNERNHETQCQRNRQVNAVKTKVFLMLKQQQVRKIKCAGANGSLSDVNEEVSIISALLSFSPVLRALQA